MRCADCGKNVVTFKKVVDGDVKHICLDCITRSTGSKVDFTSSVPQYDMVWRVELEDGTEQVQRFDDLDKEDVEIIYGNNSDKIIWMSMRMKGRAMV